MAETKLEVLGRYKILEVIGRGAMGVVYKAVDPVIDRIVAIKTINLTLSKEDIQEYEARFTQEIKAAGRFSHPNIVTIYDVGRTDEVAYMAMEFLNGRELKDVLASGTRLEIETTVELMLQVADGLAYAHEHGIVHRDIKPSNIMIINLPNGVLAKITDFGIARMPGSAVKTMTGVVMGSPRYMSPEQVVGKAIDQRSDIFSLGVVMYETLTGTPPFDGETLTGIMYATANTQPPPPSTRNPASPRMLDLIMEKALAKDLDRRYQSMRELCNDLRDVRRLLTGATGARPLVPLDALAPKKPSGDVATGPISGHQRTFETDDEAGRPLKVAKEFDSFSATVKLATLTRQTAEFRDYITETQKMRAYTGAVPPPAAPVAPPRVSIPRGDITGGHRGPSPVAPRSPWMPIVLLGGMALVLIGLLVALLR